jgi:hypothetical protein
VEVKILNNRNKLHTLLKAGVLAVILIFTSCTNITTATNEISNCEEAVEYIVQQLSINKDKSLIYVWGPVDEGEEVFSTKEYVMETPEKGYVIYIDLLPRANLFHPVQYVFLSENKDQLIVNDAMSLPLNYDDYVMIDTEIGLYLMSLQNRRATIPEDIVQFPMKSPSDSRWAVLLNGGHSSGSNHIRYWNDLSNIYITLVNIYGFLDENIIVLCSDGLDPAPDQSNGQNSDPDLDGDGDDDIMYSCILSNVDMVFADLANILTEGSELFVFQTDHGSSISGWSTLFNLWNGEELTDAHFASLLDALPDCEIVCTFEPCFSGGFLDDVVVPPGPIVASSACRHDEYSWAMNDLIYDEYAFYWTAAVNGEDAYGNPHDADYNQDGFITMDEAFIYAEAHDTQPESPQYGDYPEGIGEIITLWPGSQSPETPTKPNGPDVWILNIETTFSTTAIEPDGESVYYKFDWGDGNISEWVGPYLSGQSGEASYAWSELGDYEVKAVAKDINGVQGNWSEPASILIVENEEPSIPIIDGQSIGFGGIDYDFTFQSMDPDLHQIYYMVDWDDGEKTEWLGPYNSGEQFSIIHSWNKKGEYWIKAWAKDTLEGESGQASFKINILTDKSVQRYSGFTQILEIIINRFPIVGYLLRI